MVLGQCLSVTLNQARLKMHYFNRLVPIPSATQENPKFKACLSNSEFQVVLRVPRLQRKRGSPGECRSVVMLLPRLSKVLASILSAPLKKEKK